MRSDLIIGLVCSALLHVLLLYGDRLVSHHKQEVVKVEEAPVVQIEMPPLEPDPPEVVESTDASDQVQDLAPPSLIDVPTTVPVNAFVQPVQPPPPPGMTANSGAITIPVSRPTVSRQGMTNVFNMEDLDQKPEPRVRVSPTFPFEMKRQGISGKVEVEFIINEHGDVEDPRVISSSHHEFESSALQAVLKWKFKPGKKGGRYVKVHASQEIGFTLNDNN